jgi:hypothetical protein
MFKKVDATTAFRVHAFERDQYLVWAKPDSTWAWTLAPGPNGGIRLVTRLRERFEWRKPGQALVSRILMEVGDFPMIRRMLLGIRKRAEQHSSAGAAATSALSRR